MSATRTVWGKIRTAKVIAFDEHRKCGVAVDVDNNEKIYFEIRSCRKVSADDNGNPHIQRAVFKHPPRVENQILYIPDLRPPSFESEKPRVFVWGYKHFYLRSLQDQNSANELEGALDAPEASVEPVRNGHKSVIITETAPALIVSVQATTSATKTAIPEWSPGTPGPDTEGLAGESGEERPGYMDPETLAVAAGGHNRGKKSKPGQNGWTDGRGRKGRGCHQDWRRRH